jgi:chemotaxis protein methyltransferase CheR
VSADAERENLLSFRACIEGSLGLMFDDGREGFLAEVLERRARARHLSQLAYVERLRSALSADEQRALARELTIGETYFFRNPDQFRALKECVLAARLSSPRRGHKLSFLSAACASGEEPYSLAIALRQVGIDASWPVSIRAIDVNAEALAKAARAHYSAWALRELDPDTLRTWFSPEGNAQVLSPAIRSQVTFEEKNLVQDDPDLWANEAYDVVFCRNVLMYFSQAQAERVVARLAASLVPGGYLFLGHAETLRGLSNDFHLLHSHDTFYYQRKEERTVTRVQAAALPAPSPPSPFPPREPEWASTWLDTVQRASARVHELLEPPSGRNAGEGRPVVTRPVELGAALELMREERFADALTHLSLVAGDTSSDPEAQLLRAALLTHQGALAPAEAACKQLLALDELNAGAHYLLALCRERAGAKDDAREHDQTAIYLDPAFAMPRLHLGLMARREGDREGAKRELGLALMLLKNEDPARVLLFGGGFHRGALLALCRAELVAAGGVP